MRPALRALTLLLCSTAVLVPSLASAQSRRRGPAVVSDVWSDPAPGVRYLRRTTSTPTQVHVIVADLTAAGVRAVATPYAARWATVAEFAEAQQVEVAVNGGFWGDLQGPRGLAAGGGSPWPRVAPDPEYGTLVIDASGRAAIHQPDDPPDLALAREAVSGRPVLVIDGAPDVEALEGFPTASDRAPRTAVGVSRDGRTLLVAVVDGRQRDSRGMSLHELATMLVELGAYRALNLDGGGSSEMFVRHAGGVVNVPSRGRWEIAVDELLGTGEQTRTTRDGSEVFVRGREREVINHLGILAPSPEVAVSAHASSVGGLVPIEVPRPLPPRVRLGLWRETLARAAAIFVPGLAAVLVLLALRRVRARRARVNR